MKTLNITSTLIALLIGTAMSYAQSSVMKNPVSHTLKNGMTIIIAENQATHKVYANLSFEAANAYTEEKATVQAVLTTLLNQQLTALDAGLSYTDKGINLATNSADFEAALQTMYAYINAPVFDQEALTNAKATIQAHLIAQDKYFPEVVNTISLNKLSLEEVNTYYTEINKPDQTVLIIVGNISPSSAKAFTKTVMGRKQATAISRAYLAAN